MLYLHVSINGIHAASCSLLWKSQFLHNVISLVIINSRRRLAGWLQRRGHSWEVISAVFKALLPQLDERVLGSYKLEGRIPH